MKSSLDTGFVLRSHGQVLVELPAVAAVAEWGCKVPCAERSLNSAAALTIAFRVEEFTSSLRKQCSVHQNTSGTPTWTAPLTWRV